MHLTAALTGSSTSSAGDQASAGAGDKKRFVCASLPDSQAIIDAGQRVMGEQIFSTNIFPVCIIVLWCGRSGAVRHLRRGVQCRGPRGGGQPRQDASRWAQYSTLQYSTVEYSTVKYSNVEPRQDASELPPSSAIIFRPSGEAQTDRMEDRARGGAVSCRLVFCLSIK